MFDLLNAIARAGSGRRVWFLHRARNGCEYPFGEQVRRTVREHDNARAHIRYSQPGAEDFDGRDYDAQGRIDIEVPKQLLPFDDYECYLCGPTPFTKSLHCGRRSTGAARSCIDCESFDPASALTGDAVPQGQAPKCASDEELSGKREVRFERFRVTDAWDPARESILDLGEHQGLIPPSGCRSGICRTCMCELAQGGGGLPGGTPERAGFGPHPDLCPGPRMR